MAGRHDRSHVTRLARVARLDCMGLTQSSLVRIGCILMIAAAGMRAAFTALFELDKFGLSQQWPIQWSVGYAVFIGAYALASRTRIDEREQTALLILQSLSALYLVWLYPNFLITALLVVVSWQIAWSTTLRRAIAAVLAQSAALALMKCVDQADGMSLLVLVSTCGFELFAVSAAHLARSEASARQSLANANAELRATHALLAESISFKRLGLGKVIGTRTWGGEIWLTASNVLVDKGIAETVKRANIPYAVEVLPWNRAYGRTQSERDTCLFATARLDNREKLFVWVGPYASNVWGVYGKGDFAGTVRLLADLKPYRIGAVVNDAKADYLKEGGVTNVKSVVDDRQNPPRLFLPKDDPNRIDLWVTGYYGAHQVARSAKVSDLKLVFVVREIPLYLACSPQTSPTVIKALTEALDKIRAEGLPEKLTAAYEKKFAQ